MFDFFRKLFAKGNNDSTNYALLDIDELTRRYLSAKEDKRKLIRNCFNDDNSWNLILQSKTLAVEAVRQHNYDLVKKGIVLHSIENARYDPRDNTARLSLLYNSARKLKGDPDALFKQIAKISDNNIKNVLLSFIERKEADKSISIMGYKEIDKPHFDYIESSK